MHGGSASIYHGSTSIHHGSTSIYHGSTSIHHGLTSIRHSSTSIHHGSTSIYHGSASMHDGSTSMHDSSMLGDDGSVFNRMVQCGGRWLTVKWQRLNIAKAGSQSNGDDLMLSSNSLRFGARHCVPGIILPRRFWLFGSGGVRVGPPQWRFLLSWGCSVGRCVGLFPLPEPRCWRVVTANILMPSGPVHIAGVTVGRFLEQARRRSGPGCQ